jgi:signal transduction histidine kinase/HAMP domain-containing protein
MTMSLKTRLRIPIITLVAGIVLVLSYFNLRNLLLVKLDATAERARIAARQAEIAVMQRVREKSAMHLPPPQNEEEMFALWREIVESDSELQAQLRDASLNAEAILEILILDPDGVVLSASNPVPVGRLAPDLERFDTWRRQPVWEQMWALLRDPPDFQAMPFQPLGASGRPMFLVRVTISGKLLRDFVIRPVQEMALASLLSLVLGVFLAFFVSNLAIRPLSRISETLDRIARGEPAREAAREESGTQELAAVQSKLSILGQQVMGARQDVSQLRVNVDQMLQRLEDAVLLFDPERRLVMAGGAAELLLGFPREWMVGRRLEELLPDNTLLGAAVQGAVQLRQPLRDRLVFSGRKDAPETRLLVNLDFLEHFPQRDRTGYLLTLKDAESRRQLESQLDISSRLAAINRLTGGVAHEIKNPLNAIALHLEILRSRLQEEMEQAPEEIEVIAREIARLDRVVKTFLDFTRPVDLEITEIDLGEMSRELGLLLASHAERSQVALDIQTAVEQGFIRGDRDLIKQALLNVAVNGIEAMGNGGQLHIQTAREGAEIVVRIIDQGPGIPPEIRAKIFNLYFTTKKTGTGIGLAMTFRVVQLHNATINVASEPGQGTTFEFRFPAVDAGTGQANRVINSTGEMLPAV